MVGRGGRLPFAYRRGPVTIFSAIIYISLLTALLVIHNTVPSAHNDYIPEEISLDEAWHDLQRLTKSFHPYNSHANDDVRNWLLLRIEEILGNGKGPSARVSEDFATVENDLSSNVTSSSQGLSVYFEGTNIMVHVKGTPEFSHLGAVLVNAHYDSVSTGYGATDDGVGVVSILQLIKYFTTGKHRPRRDIIFLLNNGEEDFLNGARVFMQHPISSLPRTFLNLEGAGAGGRAVLFRSTDTEVTKFYKAAGHPYGSVLTGDGFQMGLVRSQTDYVVFNGDLGLRGLDVAFLEPRARYHTSEDSTRYTSIDSVWHMLSAAIATVEGLALDKSEEYQGRVSNDKRIVDNGGSRAVWFDMFGQAFALFKLRTMFIISILLLVLAPLFLIILTVVLVRQDKWYLFDGRVVTINYDAGPDEGQLPQKYKMKGLYGLWRFPVTTIVSVGLLAGFVQLTIRVNPLIVYCSPYVVWSEFLSLFFIFFWFLYRSADFTRPSALVRVYSLIWLFILSWVGLVLVTVSENNYQLAGGYFILFYFTSIFVATAISFLEMLVLMKKRVYLEDLPRLRWWHKQNHKDDDESDDTRPSSHNRQAEDNQDATESSALLQSSTSFQGYGSRRRSRDEGNAEELEKEEGKFDYFGEEQHWSGMLPKWTWVLQILVLAPINIILVGQIGLLITSALRQTPADGSSVAAAYVVIAAFSILIVLPLTPFIHRFTYHIPTLLLAVAVGTALYNQLAFPFDQGNRLKVFFRQDLDLDTGVNRVSITGRSDYIHSVIDSLPSSRSMQVTCNPPPQENRYGLLDCSWQGLPPAVVPRDPSVLPEKSYIDYMHLDVVRSNLSSEGTITISGNNSRACKLFFDPPLSDFKIVDPPNAAEDPRFKPVGPDGVKELRMWSREWERGWKVWVKWGKEGGLDGRAVCAWSDQNDPEAIPALTEVRRYAPHWVTVSKTTDGLVEGLKRFKM
ncbi:endoplasmic reticulum metallopeptidase 1 [Eremomyces bilateralis CBS 781.70]|uniref:Peptide hydrolase n=1 Tax=Eremomyces bilateralis CBS 781.70 TaxID=1392243 RepID=A0A6G1GE87_9PEZI|nr:endoplasmic reticulum metallopeptidase 1 [Eremomyces bilateralis CBS 781.70]KAF1816334.1 endoplasmic reticulum metallopeptidase 1 [Eremomyces bilateralis CBS 781.70]